MCEEAGIEPIMTTTADCNATDMADLIELVVFPRPLLFIIPATRCTSIHDPTRRVQPGAPMAVFFGLPDCPFGLL